MSTNEFDLLVIGSGPGGYCAAIRAAQLGLRVACVEKEPALGGTCLRVGCIPSKALLESSERFHAAQTEFAAHGIKVSGLELDLAALMKRKDRIVTMLTQGIDGLFRKNKVTRFQGLGRLDGKGKVRVDGAAPHELTAKWILVATGSKPATLPGVQLAGDRIGTSTEALCWNKVPEHLVVIGAGYIGLELGSVWRRLGARVTVVEYLDRILPGTDREIGTEAQKLLTKQGLEFRLQRKVVGASVQGDACVVECEGEAPIACDRVLLAAGRIPNTEGLGLETAGIQATDRGFIPVDLHFATTAPGIYAIGDVIGGLMLAHKAEEEGVACVETLVKGTGHLNYDAIPGVVYLQPEIGTVGKTEEQLTTAGVAFRKGVFPFRANGRASAGHTDGKAKILADAATDRILGVHIIGPHAGELINEAAVAMSFGASSEDLARTCHAHPTLGEVLKEAALAVDGRAIHI